jgi:hypothetical protein
VPRVPSESLCFCIIMTMGYWGGALTAEQRNNVAWLGTRVVLYVPVTLPFHCFLLRGTWEGYIPVWLSLFFDGVEMGIKLLGVSVLRQELRGGWLFVG